MKMFYLTLLFRRPWNERIMVKALKWETQQVWEVRGRSYQLDTGCTWTVLTLMRELEDEAVTVT